MLIRLTTADLIVELDPGRGADVLALVDVRTGVDVLFRTPWRERADAIRHGQAPSTVDPTATWMEQYRGGWQTLCPSAGEPRTIHGAPVSFHGEASVVPWTVDEVTATSARLHVDLFSLPIRIDRTLTVEASALHQVDVLTNLSDVPLGFDYSNHPAFGGAFLEGECRIETGATRFTSSEGRENAIVAGSVNEWPWAAGSDGKPVDLRVLPSAGHPREILGWLSDFTEHWASIANTRLDVAVRLEWDGAHVPYAWFWQELNAGAEAPWFRRARAAAIEPASMTTDRARGSALALAGGASVTLPLTVALERPEAG
jgi:hypothetical protein